MTLSTRSAPPGSSTTPPTGCNSRQDHAGAISNVIRSSRKKTHRQKNRVHGRSSRAPRNSVIQVCHESNQQQWQQQQRDNCGEDKCSELKNDALTAEKCFINWDLQAAIAFTIGCLLFWVDSIWELSFLYEQDISAASTHDIVRVWLLFWGSAFFVVGCGFWLQSVLKAAAEVKLMQEEEARSGAGASWM